MPDTSDLRRYIIRLTDDVRPGQQTIPVSIPDGPTLVFRRDPKNQVFEHEALLTPTQARKLYGFEVKEKSTLAGMKKADLEAEVKRRDLKVKGAGASDNVTADDLRNALADSAAAAGSSSSAAVDSPATSDKGGN
jgi:hypothetical protein